LMYLPPGIYFMYKSIIMTFTDDDIHMIIIIMRITNNSPLQSPDPLVTFVGTITKSSSSIISRFLL
jgi:hypothetical protein